MLDLVIIGAGPYGLATAAEAKKKNLNYLLIGTPMKFWLETMPSFMLLRSPFRASSLYSPDNSLSLQNFYQETERSLPQSKSIPLKIYIEYINWYLKKADLNIKSEEVTKVSKEADGTYTVITESEETFKSKNVVIAVGNPPFATIPETVKNLDKNYYSHTFELPNYERLADKKVLVVGGGQSALEACWGLIQVGAKVELSHKQDKLYWHNIPLRINIPLLHLFVACPTVLEIVPYGLRKAVGDMVSEPTVDKWLREKVEQKIKEYPKTKINNTQVISDEVKVTFNNGQETIVDHVVLGTGYDVDVRKMAILDKQLINELQIRDGYPVLNKNLESKVKGLFFTGVPAKGRFGPTFNFIFASPAGAKRIVRGIN